MSPPKDMVKDAGTEIQQPIRFKHRCEYFLIRGLSRVVCLLPYRLALALGWVLALVAFYVVRFRVRTAISRIRSVLGDAVSHRQARRIAWISLRNLFFNGIEILRFPHMNRAWVERHAEVVNGEEITACRDARQGAILAVPHMGNWDLAGVGTSLLGYPIFFMARRQKNPLTDAFLNRLRGVTGVETVMTDHRGALRQVVRNLKNGHIFAMLPDVRARETGVYVPFLGGIAALATGMEVFARRADVPIFPACAHRIGWTRHRWVVYAPVRADPAVEREADQQRIMEEVMQRFDTAIQTHPEQYFWYNKRWILDPLNLPNAQNSP